MALNSPRFRWSQRLRQVENNNPPMRLGDRGHAVRLVQQSLIDLGVGALPVSVRKYGSPDGIYGRETRAAVHKFQSGQPGLVADGVVGRNTIRRLDTLLPNANPRLPALPSRARYIVPGIKPAIAQPTNNVCWATAYTILRSWKDKTSYQISTVMDMVGAKYRRRFDNNQGLSWGDYPEFCRLARMRSEPLQCLPVSSWVELLRTYGLLFIGAPWLPGPVGGHVRVLEGVTGDGNMGSTWMKIIDPWGGRRYPETLELFNAIYEDGGLQDRKIQIAHF